MSKAKPGIERAKASKENRSKVVSKASEVVNAVLEPASKVADLLKFVGNFYPACGTAGSILQVRHEVFRRPQMLMGTRAL